MGVLYANVAGVWEPIGLPPVDGVLGVVAGTGIAVDDTDPTRPVVTAVGEEVTVAKTAPTDTSEVWAIADATYGSTLYVKDGAAWDTVGSQPADDTLDQRLIQMEAQAARLPLGIIAVGWLDFGDGVAIAENQALTNVLNATTATDRRYRLNMVIRAATASVNIAPWMPIYRDGTILTDRHQQILGNIPYNNLVISYLLTGTGATNGYKVHIVNTANAITAWSSGGNFYIEDVGAI